MTPREYYDRLLAAATELRALEDVAHIPLFGDTYDAGLVRGRCATAADAARTATIAAWCRFGQKLWWPEPWPHKSQDADTERTEAGPEVPAIDPKTGKEIQW